MMSFTLIFIYFINKLIFFTAKLKEKLYSENSNFYNWRFGKIFYTKKGSGSPLLLIHDMNCTSSDFEWKEVIQKFSEKHTVYTIDLIGCGRSEKQKLTYTNYLYVQLISDFIKNVIKHNTDVISTGKTSSAVIMACYIDPQLFNNIIFVNPYNVYSMNKYPTYYHKALKHFIDMPIIGTLFYNIAVSKKSIKDSFKTLYFANQKKPYKKQIAAYYEAAHLSGSVSKFAYSSMLCHYTNTNMIHAIRELNNNICIVAGEQMDNLKDILDSYTTLNSSIETAILPNTKYLPQIESPEDFVSLCEIYL